MTAPTGTMHLTDTELRLILDALENHHPADGPRQELRRRAMRKVAAELAIKERPHIERGIIHEKSA